YLIGIGYKPLTKEEERVLEKASKIFTFKRTEEIFKGYPQHAFFKEKIKVVKGVNELLEEIEGEREDVVVLAGGDPLLFGVGEKLISYFSQEEIKIFPDLTTPQVLCSRLKIPYYKVRIYSLHGRKFQRESFLREVLQSEYLFVYTDSENNPSFIADILEREGLNELILYVGERLGYAEERIFKGHPSELVNSKFAEPNSLLIENSNWGKHIILGIKEREIFHERGMITKDEARAIILHKLEPPLRGVIWDIGAGSGSVSLELARLSPYLEIYAIEKKENYCRLIENNCKKFLINNIKVIHGEAPEAFLNLPSPDRVFVGGTSGKLKEILNFLESLKDLKISVFSFITYENLKEALEFFKDKPYELDLLQLQVNKFSSLKDYHFFKPENPLFILKVIK
ncbi:MAG: precorrin-6y C5,15-methyltransferase (decarboxylating) subunit CbiE, partial [Caldimicrobium sp.]